MVPGGTPRARSGASAPKSANSTAAGDCATILRLGQRSPAAIACHRLMASRTPAPSRRRTDSARARACCSRIRLRAAGGGGAGAGRAGGGVPSAWRADAAGASLARADSSGRSGGRGGSLCGRRTALGDMAGGAVRRGVGALPARPAAAARQARLAPQPLASGDERLRRAAVRAAGRDELAGQWQPAQ